MDINIRLLRADEIECRVATVNEKGASLLLFKDARVDLKILDETFGPFGWQRTHQSIDGNLYCTISLWDSEKQQWISKQDVGTKSYSEKEKGQASDSFKRAAFCVGVGRELYTAPFIWISAAKAKVQKKEDKYVVNEHFTVSYIAYDSNREIAALVIKDSKGNVVYSMQQDSQAKEATVQESVLSDAERVLLLAELNRTGVTMDTVLERYGLNNINQMTVEVYDKAMNSLKKSKSKAA